MKTLSYGDVCRIYSSKMDHLQNLTHMKDNAKLYMEYNTPFPRIFHLPNDSVELITHFFKQLIVDEIRSVNLGPWKKEYRRREHEEYMNDVCDNCDREWDW